MKIFQYVLEDDKKTSKAYHKFHSSIKQTTLRTYNHHGSIQESFEKTLPSNEKERGEIYQRMIRS